VTSAHTTSSISPASWRADIEPVMIRHPPAAIVIDGHLSSLLPLSIHNAIPRKRCHE